MRSISWKELAERKGFSSPVEMVKHFYWTERKTLAETADILLISVRALWEFMRKNGIPTRKTTQKQTLPVPSVEERAV